MIDEQGQQLGVVGIKEAWTRAEEAGLDLVEISPQANPPVAKIVDWGKFQYDKLKQQQKAKKKQRSQELKQVRFGLKIGQHDIDVKSKKIQEFLERGSKVRLVAFFRGREITHPELGHQLLEKVVQGLGVEVAVDQPPQLTGKQLGMVIRKK